MSDRKPRSGGDRALVVVAGSGRSGTSLCSGLLHRLGFHIPQPEVQANRTNPRGFGEPQWAIDFHQRWLDTVDVSKEDARPAALVKMARVGNRPKVREELSTWLGELFAEADRVVVKDPRLTWFTGLYAEVAAELDAQFFVVTMVRHPVETTRSREIAYGRGMTDTARMTAWVNMMQAVEFATRDHPRALLSYRDVLADWRGTLEAADRHLGLELFDRATAEEIEAADALVDPSLRRTEATWDEYDVPADLRSVAEATYRELGALVIGSDHEPDESALGRLDGLRDDYASFYTSCEQVARTSILAARRDQKRKDTAHAASLERELKAARRKLTAQDSVQETAPSPGQRLGRLGNAPKRAARRVRRMVAEQTAESTESERAGTTEADHRPRHHVYLLAVWLTGAGGVARAVTTMANSLSRTCEVEVISVERGRDEPVFALDPRVKVSYLFDQREETGRGGDDEVFPEPVVQRIRDRLAEITSGVVISNRPVLSAIAAEACGDDVVVIAREHSAFVSKKESETEGLRRTGDRLDAVVTLTETDRVEHARNMEGRSAEVLVIPNAVPWPLKGEKAREDKVVVAAGALVPNKGHARLFEAFAPVARAHPEWQLHLYGHGRLKQELLGQIADLGLTDQIVVKGYTDNFQRVLNRAAIFALSSYFEAFGLVLVEAMSKGVPVVTFDCPSGPRHVVDDGVNGILVPDGDIEAYTDALRSLVEDEEKRQVMGRAGRQAAQRFGPNRVANTWLDLIDRLVARRTDAAGSTR